MILTAPAFKFDAFKHVPYLFWKVSIKTEGKYDLDSPGPEIRLYGPRTKSSYRRPPPSKCRPLVGHCDMASSARLRFQIAFLEQLGFTWGPPVTHNESPPRNLMQVLPNPKLQSLDPKPNFPVQGVCLNSSIVLFAPNLLVEMLNRCTVDEVHTLGIFITSGICVASLSGRTPLRKKHPKRNTLICW